MQDRRCGRCSAVARPTLVTTTRGGRIINYRCTGCDNKFEVGGPERPYILAIGSALLLGSAGYVAWGIYGSGTLDQELLVPGGLSAALALYGLWQFVSERAAARANPPL